MNKTPVVVKKRVIYWFTRHPWLKLISLILAVIVWFYVNGKIITSSF
jgi:hypothetical protein